MSKVTKVIVNGRTFANRGMIESDIPPMRCSSKWEKLGAEGDIPSKVDLRPFCSPVENQARSNSCCANAVAGLFEYLNRKHCAVTGDAPGDISRLFIYYVGREYDMGKRHRHEKFIPEIKDAGMSIPGALSALMAKGACIEPEWPFDLTKVNERPPEQCFNDALNFKIRDSIQVPVDGDKMRRVLASGYPLVFGLKLTQAFFRPGPSGLQKTPHPSDPKSATHGLHAMVAVGYDDERRVFIVRNSWGENWGDHGYCYIPYSYLANPKFNVCGQFAIRGLDNVDLTPDVNPHEERDEQGAVKTPKCNNGHPLQHVDPYGDKGFVCNRCDATKGAADLSWHCRLCGYDACDDCVAPPPPPPDGGGEEAAEDYEGETRTYVNVSGCRAAVRATPDLSSDLVTTLAVNTKVKVAPPHSEYEDHPLVRSGRRVRLVAPVQGYASLVNSKGGRVFSAVTPEEAGKITLPYQGPTRAGFTALADSSKEEEMMLTGFNLTEHDLIAQGADRYGSFDITGTWDGSGEEYRVVKQYKGKNAVYWRLKLQGRRLEGSWAFTEFGASKGKIAIDLLKATLRYHRGPVYAEFKAAAGDAAPTPMLLRGFRLDAQALAAEGKDKYGDFSLTGAWDEDAQQYRAVKQYHGKNAVYWRLRLTGRRLEGPWAFKEDGEQKGTIFILLLKGEEHNQEKKGEEHGEGEQEQKEEEEVVQKWTYSGKAEGCYFGELYNGQEKPVVFTSLTVGEDGVFTAQASDEWGTLDVTGTVEGRQLNARAEYSDGGGGNDCYPTNWELWYDSSNKKLDGKRTDAREGRTESSSLRILLTEGVARCGQGHPLVPVDPYGQRGYICNRCRKHYSQEEQPISHHCEHCGYDCCPDCVAKQLEEEVHDEVEFEEVEEEKEEDGGGGGEAVDMEEEFSARLEAKRVFDRHDTDKSGTIDFDELKVMLRQMGMPSNEIVAKGFMQKFDTNGDGTLSFKEFIGILGLSYSDEDLDMAGGTLPPVTKKELTVDFRPLEDPAPEDWAGIYIDLFSEETPGQVMQLDGPPSGASSSGAVPTLGVSFGDKVIKWNDGVNFWQLQDGGNALPPAPPAAKRRRRPPAP